MYNKVELCGVNTALLPVLTEAEKRQLLTRAHAGDRQARERMVEGNLRLVLSVVQRFAQRGANMDDLFQVGCIGLIKAIDNFDPAQPVRFSTYGVPMIIGEIRRFLRDNNALRVSRSLRDTAYRAMQCRELLEKRLGREPTMGEVAKEAGLDRREVTAALESVVEPVSLEEPVYSDGGDAMYLIDQVRDPEGEDSWISGLEFRQTVAALTPREKKIMELRYLQGMTQTQVAQEIGISQAQVSRLEKGALNQFRTAEQEKGAAAPTDAAAPLFSGGICGGWRHRPADAALLYCVPAPPAPGQTAPGPACAAAPTHPCGRWTCCIPAPLPPCAPWHRAGRCTRPAAPPAVPGRPSWHVPPDPSWYSLCGGRRQYAAAGLTFAAQVRYTDNGHKNRGAERLRSAGCGVPFT